MTKFQLIVFDSCYEKLHEEKSRIKGFVDAEKRAIELWHEYHSFHQDNVEVALIPEGEPFGYFDYFVYTLDADHNLGWRIVRWGIYGPLYTDLLQDYEIEQLEEWRNEQEVSVLDLNYDELRTLYHEIGFGSIYTSDYENSLGVDEDEAFNCSERFLDKMYNEGKDESYTEEDFVEFVTDFYY